MAVFLVLVDCHLLAVPINTCWEYHSSNCVLRKSFLQIYSLIGDDRLCLGAASTDGYCWCGGDPGMPP